MMLAAACRWQDACDEREYKNNNMFVEREDVRQQSQRWCMNIYKKTNTGVYLNEPRNNKRSERCVGVNGKKEQQQNKKPFCSPNALAEAITSAKQTADDVFMVCLL
jgi:hypothetical protein